MTWVQKNYLSQKLIYENKLKEGNRVTVRVFPITSELPRTFKCGFTTPLKAADDALHIAVAAMNGIPFLLTWNCRHLANATMRPMIESVCMGRGLRAPIICTPEELLEAKP